MIPKRTNVYGVIHSSISKIEITKKFSAHGWKISKASWFDWEVANDFAELILEGDKELLIHGPVSPNYFNILAEQMKEVGLSFSLELYDENQNLICEVKN